MFIMSFLRCCFPQCLGLSYFSILWTININTSKHISSQVVLVIKHQNLFSEMAQILFPYTYIGINHLVGWFIAMFEQQNRAEGEEPAWASLTLASDLGLLSTTNYMSICHSVSTCCERFQICVYNYPCPLFLFIWNPLVRG
jgi:hypothetical protein